MPAAMKFLVHAVAFAMACVGGVHGLFPSLGQVPPMGLNEAEEAALVDPDVALVGNGTFFQPIDHKHPHKGYFSTSYWYNATNWQGPGSPVCFLGRTI